LFSSQKTFAREKAQKNLRKINKMPLEQEVSSESSSESSDEQVFLDFSGKINEIQQ
jgi:hypothetical protein